jgi:hypothetical protein
MIGLMRLSTREVTTAPKAAPTTTATARSTTFPRIRNFLNSLNIIPPGDHLGYGPVP